MSNPDIFWKVNTISWLDGSFVMNESLIDEFIVMLECTYQELWKYVGFTLCTGVSETNCASMV